ncbi:hypothetical protein VTI74DRAFT_11608 [Chaetomium olivicolor]
MTPMETAMMDFATGVDNTYAKVRADWKLLFTENNTTMHDPKSGLRSRSALLALTLSCIKFVLSLDSEAVVIPVLRTWTSNQLSAGEQLVRGLACSLVSERGLNISQDGSLRGSDESNAKHHVLGAKAHFIENAQATLAGFARDCEILSSHISLRPLSSGKHHDLIRELEMVAEHKKIAAAE